MRDLLRKRGQWVRQRTSHLLAVQNLLARNRGESLTGNAIKRLSPEAKDPLLSEPNLALAVNSNLGVIQALDEQITVLEKTVKAHIKPGGGLPLLLSVSGVGDILGLTILLATGEISRFASVGQYASYCRCVGSERISNGKRKRRGNRKNGNCYLAWAFVEAANFAIRYHPQIKRYYQRKAARSPGVVAHKLARACYYILRDQVPFDVNKAFA